MSWMRAAIACGLPFSDGSIYGRGQPIGQTALDLVERGQHRLDVVFDVGRRRHERLELRGLRQQRLPVDVGARREPAGHLGQPQAILRVRQELHEVPRGGLVLALAVHIHALGLQQHHARHAGLPRGDRRDTIVQLRVLRLDFADHPGLTEQHGGGAGSEGVGIVRHLRVVDVPGLHGIDIEPQRIATGLVVVAVVPLAWALLLDQRTAGSFQDVAEFLADAAALSGQAQADAAARHAALAVDLDQFLRGLDQFRERGGRAGQTGFLEIRLVPGHRGAAAFEERQAVGLAVQRKEIDCELPPHTGFQVRVDIRRVGFDQLVIDEVHADVRADIENIGAGSGRHRRGQLLLRLAQRGAEEVEGDARMGLGVLRGDGLIHRLDFRIAGPDRELGVGGARLIGFRPRRPRQPRRAHHDDAAYPHPSVRSSTPPCVSISIELHMRYASCPERSSATRGRA